MNSPFKIVVDVKDVSDEIFMAQNIGEIRFNDETGQLSTFPNGSILIRFRGRQYMVDSAEIIREICMRLVYGQDN